MSKKHLIVGGSKGIGLAITEQLLLENQQVIVLSRSNDLLPSHPNLEHHTFDVLEDDINEIDLPDELNGLVYCPGSINLKPFRALKPAAFLADFEINVLGAVKVLKKCQKALSAAGSSSVVLFSTVAVGQGMPYHTSVATSKGAIEGLGKSLAAEWAPKVRVNILAPSLTATPLAEKLLSTEEKKAASSNRHPLKRFGQPEDLAAMACLLLSDKGSWISGQVIGIDGGMSTLRPM